MKTPEQKRVYSVRWRAEHPEQKRAYHVKWYAANRDEKLASNANWHAEHPDYKAKWRKEHRDEKRAYAAKWYAEHLEQKRVYDAAWRKEHPEEVRAYATNYQHRRRANGGNFTRAAWEHLKALFGHRCAYCGRRMERLEQDHVVPLAKGGWHCSMNIVPACRSCNSRKGANAVDSGAYPTVNYR